MTEIGLTDGYRLEADVIASDATGSGRPLLAPGKDQLADVGKGALMVSLLILFLEIKETQCNHVLFFFPSYGEDNRPLRLYLAHPSCHADSTSYRYCNILQQNVTFFYPLLRTGQCSMRNDFP